MSDTPETDAIERAATDDTGAVTRMEPIWEGLQKLERERDEARAEAAKWKANHDNQVALKSAIIQRPDLRDRSERVQSLIRDRDALKAEIESIHADIKHAFFMIEEMKKNDWDELRK